MTEVWRTRTTRFVPCLVGVVALMVALITSEGMAVAGEGPLRASVRREAARLAQTNAAGGQSQSWRAQHPVMFGALIGTAGGLVVSRIDAIGGRNHDPKVALLGTGTGAFAGLVASVIQKGRAGEHVGTGTKIALVATVVGAATLSVMCAAYCGGN